MGLRRFVGVADRSIPSVKFFTVGGAAPKKLLKGDELESRHGMFLPRPTVRRCLAGHAVNRDRTDRLDDLLDIRRLMEFLIFFWCFSIEATGCHPECSRS